VKDFGRLSGARWDKLLSWFTGETVDFGYDAEGPDKLRGVVHKPLCAGRLFCDKRWQWAISQFRVCSEKPDGHEKKSQVAATEAGRNKRSVASHASQEPS